MVDNRQLRQNDLCVTSLTLNKLMLEVKVHDVVLFHRATPNFVWRGKQSEIELPSYQ